MYFICTSNRPFYLRALKSVVREVCGNGSMFPALCMLYSTCCKVWWNLRTFSMCSPWRELWTLVLVNLFFLMWEKGTSIIICTVIKLQNHLKFKFYFRSTSTKCYVRNKIIKGKIKNFPFKPIYENSKRTRAGQLSYPILLSKQKCSLYASQAHCQLRVDKKGTDQFRKIPRNFFNLKASDNYQYKQASKNTSALFSGIHIEQ